MLSLKRAKEQCVTKRFKDWRTEMYDVTHVRMIETRLCDQKFLRMGKERLRSEASLGSGRKMA